jgi:uncharacterized protein (TIGR00730 family)
MVRPSQDTLPPATGNNVADEDAHSAGSASRSYLLAEEDHEYLRRHEVRSLRLALEFTKADLVLTEQKIMSTIVVFGSARIPSPEQAQQQLKSAKDASSRKRARNLVELSIWYQVARDFGRLVSQRGGAIGPEGSPRQNVIATGGGPGIMEAANRGAADAGAPTIGYNITLPEEQAPNSYTTPELTFRFHYFAMRKMHFAMRANALAIFPGGFGTLDELFEILTLMQTRKSARMPIILFNRSHWNKLVNFPMLANIGMIGEDELSLIDFVDTAEEAWQVMLSRGLSAPTPLRDA